VNEFGLNIALPRGALLKGSLELLEQVGIDTSEVKTNDRKLLFENIGVTTMRPFDVVTYVEAGAADIGITGKDVLMERSTDKIYELLDLGYGYCRMVLAAQEGSSSASESLRRLGVMKIATKYPKIAQWYFEQSGRQIQSVEVKGSVELAPLTGLSDAIVDLTATGATLKENGLVEQEQIAECTARLVVNPVAYKLKASKIDSLVDKLREQLKSG